MHDVAVLSPAMLSNEQLTSAFETAMTEPLVEEAVEEVGSGKLIIYVVPKEWYLPDLPMDAEQRFGGHHVPEDYDREHYKILFTRARLHAADATGDDIVKSAYGRDPILVVSVDVSVPEVTGTKTPPSHVRWGDIPTPLF